MLLGSIDVELGTPVCQTWGKERESEGSINISRVQNQ